MTTANQTASIERREGAKSCIAALAELENSANHMPPATNYGEAFAAIQSGDAKFLAAQFGPMTPRQEGAFRAMAEYIHSTLSTGTPELKVWVPFVAQTPDELSAWIESVDAEDAA